MDKQTLSNYGWVIITVLVLAVMIALATPFGSYIKEGAKSTLTGLFESSENALNTGLGEAGISVNKAEFGGVPTVDGKGSVSAKDPALNHNGIIPEGGTYVTGLKFDDINYSYNCCDDYGAWCWCDAIIYRAGDNFPSTVNQYDLYLYGNYAYMVGGYGAYQDGCPYSISIDGVGTLTGFYGFNSCSGWGVGLNNTISGIYSKTEYGAILETINDKPILWLNYLFMYTNLTKMPKIPNTVSSMDYAFYQCDALAIVSEIPNGVKSIWYTFAGCDSLTTAPIIPESVTNIGGTFCDCFALEGIITINANPTTYDWCFDLYDYANPIILTGSSTMLQEIASTNREYFRTITII